MDYNSDAEMPIDNELNNDSVIHITNLSDIVRNVNINNKELILKSITEFINYTVLKKQLYNTEYQNGHNISYNTDGENDIFINGDSVQINFIYN